MELERDLTVFNNIGREHRKRTKVSSRGVYVWRCVLFVKATAAHKMPKRSDLDNFSIRTRIVLRVWKRVAARRRGRIENQNRPRTCRLFNRRRIYVVNLTCILRAKTVHLTRWKHDDDRTVSDRYENCLIVVRHVGSKVPLAIEPPPSSFVRMDDNERVAHAHTDDIGFWHVVVVARNRCECMPGQSASI